MANGYFYAFADLEAAVACGVLDESHRPSVPDSLILRTTGISLVPAEVNPETFETLSLAVMSLPLVILSPEIIPDCSAALIAPPGHAGFA